MVEEALKRVPIPKFNQLQAKAEAQIRFERDRAKRLAYKIEDLKERNRKLKAQIHTDHHDHHQDAPNELITIKVHFTDMLTILQDMFENTLNETEPFDPEAPDHDHVYTMYFTFI